MNPQILKHHAPISRLGYLDLLRGLAALYVVLFHVSLIPKPALEMPKWLNLFVSYGGTGVTLFFVISGFSMCLTWERHLNTGTPLRSFYIARFFRIAPLFYLWLILTLLRDYIFKGDAGIHSLSEIVSNIFFLFNFNAPLQHGIVWASWTIGVEMLFYFIFPIIAIYAGNTLKRSTLLLLGSIAVATLLENSIGSTGELALQNKIFNKMSFAYQLPVFLFGVVAFHVHEKMQSAIPKKLRLRYAYFLAILSIGGLIGLIIEQPTYFIWHYVSSAFYCLLLLSFSMLENNILIKPFTTYIGKISYSLYLNHPNLVYILAPLYMAIYRLGLNTGVSFLICVVITLTILVTLSHLSFKFLEEPFIRIGKKLTPVNSLKYGG
jgi:peptidoglycan/LPS O-acetylase OafA/YrhL